MQRVLFVCLGNICRSPMAEMIFKQLVKDHQLESEIQVSSVATCSYEAGNPIHLGAAKELKDHQIPVGHHLSRKITAEDFQNADWIIGMDFQNVNTLRRLAPDETTKAKVHLAAEVLPDNQTFEIEDPWYTNDFARTYAELTKILPYWLTKVVADDLVSE